ncbi:MAG: hypothetical protein PWQ06_845 [Anaerophaga sp.]|nr:hypothetical protein [Anaerophaga sp.]
MIDEYLNIDKEFCSGCGACQTICPTKAITFDKTLNGLNYPVINSSICIKCNLCYKVCSLKENINNTEIPRINELKSDAYYGYSLDSSLRFDSASGGIVSQLTKDALKNKIVDTVVCASQNENNEILLNFIKSEDVDRLPKGSIYRQVILLRDFIQNIEKKNSEKILVIGLPCHIAAVKALHEISPRIKRKELYTIALFCKQTKDERFSNFIRYYLKAPNRKDRINYRGGGWPGITSIGNKSTVCTDFRLGFMWGTFCYTPDYCLKCRDALGVNGDISVGDAWLKKYMSSDDKGSSLFLVNSEKGSELFKNAKNCIYFNKELIGNVIQSQNLKVLKEKEQISDRFQRKKKIKGRVFWVRVISEMIVTSKITVFIPPIFLKAFYRIFLK